MRLPQLRGWQAAFGGLIFLFYIGLQKAYNAGHLNDWHMALQSVEDVFFGGSFAALLAGWFGLESPTSPHVVDAKIAAAPAAAP